MQFSKKTQKNKNKKWKTKGKKGTVNKITNFITLKINFVYLSKPIYTHPLSLMDNIKMDWKPTTVKLDKIFLLLYF